MVTSDSPRGSHWSTISSPLGLDVWEVKPEHLVLQAAPAQAERLERMGYAVQELQRAQACLSTFATDEALALASTPSRHSADRRRLADDHPLPSVAELHGDRPERGGPAGRSGPCGSENDATASSRSSQCVRRRREKKEVILGCHHAREWIAVGVPYLLAEHLVTVGRRPGSAVVAQSEIWSHPMVSPDGLTHPHRTACGARING
ncbi:zinc carboxypeptidase [Pseudonocardia sp. MCCB 268]|nr:zinc carboxypeptidase [Pseudonocardia cytotoxica]